MKSATLPSLRVEPELRDAAQSVLQEGETLSGFIEASVRETIERRRTRAEFFARGMDSREEAKRSGVYFAADKVHAELGRMLARTKAKVQKGAGNGSTNGAAKEATKGATKGARRREARG